MARVYINNIKLTSVNFRKDILGKSADVINFYTEPLRPYTGVV